MSTSCPVAVPRCSAIAGLISSALSQVSLVTESGSSCSQPLLAKRPSQIVGSGRKVISGLSGDGGIRALSSTAALAATPGWRDASTDSAPVPGMKPSWSQRRQLVAKSPVPPVVSFGGPLVSQ